MHDNWCHAQIVGTTSTHLRHPGAAPEQEDVEEARFKPLTVGFRLEGLQGAMVAHVGHAFEGGRHCALVALVCSEAFPESALDSAVFHWAVASREGGTWGPPPDGWQSDPSRSTSAGMPLTL